MGDCSLEEDGVVIIMGGGATFGTLQYLRKGINTQSTYWPYCPPRDANWILVKKVTIVQFQIHQDCWTKR